MREFRRRELLVAPAKPHVAPPEPPELVSLKKVMKSKLPEEYHEIVDKAKPWLRQEEAGVLNAVSNILSTHGTALNYMRNHSAAYSKFMDHAKSIGIKEGFDEPGQKFSFKITEVDRSLMDRSDLISRILHTNHHTFSGQLSNQMLEELPKKRAKITNDLNNPNLHQNQQFRSMDLKGYLHTAELEARLVAPDLLKSINEFRKEGDNRAYTLAIEFLEDRVWSDIIDKDPLTESFKGELKKMLDTKIQKLRDAMPKKEKKPDEPKKEHTFELELGDKGAMDLLKGTIGEDCSSFVRGPAFANATCKHILDPAFLNFRAYHNDGDKRKWVGNVYSLVTEIEGKPSLVIDAIQTSPRDWISSDPKEVVKNVSHALNEFAKQHGFHKVYLSDFISNRPDLKHEFKAGKKPVIKRVKKLAGYDHLDELNIHTGGMGGREYLETFATGSMDRQKALTSVDQEVRLFEI